MRSRVILLIVLSFLAALGCESGLTDTSTEDRYPPIPTELDLDSVHFSAELDTTFMPPATPTSYFYWLWWRARNRTSFPITLDYCWLGVRLYSGPRIAWEAPTYSHCLSPGHQTIQPDRGTTVSTGATPQFHLDQGIPEGRYLVTVRWLLSGIPDTLEIRVGEVELLEDNGLTPPSAPGAETKMFIFGRSHGSTGRAVRGFVGMRIHWDDCERFPVLWETTTTNETGYFWQELTLREGIFDACVTLLVKPFNPEDGPEKVLRAGRLRLQRPAASGAPRDSLYVDVVL